MGIGIAITLLFSAQLPPPHKPPRRLGQAQTALRFLRAVLRGDYPAAYRYLAPEVRHSVSLARFKTSVLPLWRSGAGRPTELELYKLGMRFTEGGDSRLFYAFSFAADSGLKIPSVLFDVTFRDTASRAVLSFGSQTGQNSKKRPAKPAGALRKKQ